MWPFANAAASEDSSSRPTTRSQQGHLVPPLEQHNCRAFGLGRGRSRSPSPAAAVGAQFNFPSSTPATMATEEQLRALKDQLREEMRSELLGSALSAVGDPAVIKRRPEIPAFDKQHIDIWIRRTENAYIRAGITSVPEKFAFLETKFTVDVDPKINEFLYITAPSDQSWKDFLDYLRKEYGATLQQKASIFVDGFKRDGRRPSQYAATLNDKTKDVTINDIKKEMLMRELPHEIRRMLQERAEKLTFEELAGLADSYFDRDGKPRDCNPSSISSVMDTPSDQASDAEHDDINAINNRFRQRQSFNKRNRQSTSQPSHPRLDSRSTGRSLPDKNSDPSNSNLCYFHDKFGDKARNCQEACPRFDAHRFPGNGKAGRK